MSKDKLKLHVGCGDVIIPGYVNIDIRSLDGVDVVSDIRNLPYPDNSVDFIYSCANIEHFDRNEWKAVLAHFFSKLKPGGALRLSTADFEAVCKRYQQEGNIEELLGLVVGGQKNDYDWHGMVFDFNLLRKGLESVGFENIRRYNWRDTELAELGIDDYSQAFLPHMDKENGMLMM